MVPNEYCDQLSARLKTPIPKERVFLTLPFSPDSLACLGECCQKPHVTVMRYDCALDFLLSSFGVQMILIQYRLRGGTFDEIETDYPELPGLLYLI